MSATLNETGGGEAGWHASGDGADEADSGSPSIFANIAAAVGEQHPMALATTIARTLGTGTTLKAGVQSAASASDMALVAMHAMDPYRALMYNTDHFVGVQLKQLLEAATRFFSLYHSYSGKGIAGDDDDDDNAVQAHRALLAVIDQLLLTASQAGFGGLPCPGRSDDVHSNWLLESAKEEQITDRSSTYGRHAAEDGADAITTAVLKLSNDTFERRERIRESASIVTNILTNT